ncbi:hypothetical protein UFOVP687_8 [uncultured Caudovirales phage]|uniref:Uncharacterized protein n=1 Tax=uncultured Caudovirales phage TaxID=2100421 RepID=A0A6J5M370_9CAUD|nr:hypothetical protein UFOVP414_48 [uncultured Caudovirales phage]CAB4157505.1 hypothetical protein UFOVP687_8 [uncultured Caudovirales phage]
MNANHVGSLYPDSFGNFGVAQAVTVNVGSTGNAVARIPVAGGTSYIVRRITVANANKSIATANVVILTSNDGNASNAVSNVTVLSSVTSTSTWQDIPLATAAATTVYSAGSLYVKVNTAVSGGTCDITVYGDIVTL